MTARDTARALLAPLLTSAADAVAALPAARPGMPSALPALAVEVGVARTHMYAAPRWGIELAVAILVATGHRIEIRIERPEVTE